MPITDIGKYEVGEIDNTLDKSDLYNGITEYENTHADKVSAYIKQYPPVLEGEDAKNDPMFFRKEFYKFISELPPRDPMPANYEEPIKMEKLFGPQYVELYQLALEEEMNSKEFMEGVLASSTQEHSGPKWKKRPIVFVGGPSASGKTTAAKGAIEKASQFLEKDEKQTGNNKVIFIDGGKAREVSQIRNLALKAANNRGYSGIKDLNANSQVLRKVKHRVYQFAMHKTTAGVVIPDTFSAFMKPGNKSMKMLQTAKGLTDAVPIFTRTKGQDPSLFQEVVQFMGSSRAWMTGPVKEQSLENLNVKAGAESKAYGKNGFYMGVVGSKMAERWFKENFKDNLSMTIVNDLVLKKLDSETGEYVDAKPNDKDAIMISKRAFKDWIDDTSKSKLPLRDFAKAAVSNPKYGSLIQTSGEIKLFTAKEQLNKLIDSKKFKEDTSHLIQIYTAITPDIFKNKEKLEELKQQVNVVMEKHDNRVLGVQKSETYKLSNHLAKGLNQLSQELSKPELASGKKEILDNKPKSLEDTSADYNPSKISLSGYDQAIITNLTTEDIENVSTFIQKNNENPLLVSSMSEMRFVNKIDLVDPLVDPNKLSQMLTDNKLHDVTLNFTTSDAKNDFFEGGGMRMLNNASPISTLTLSGNSFTSTDVGVIATNMARGDNSKTIILKDIPNLKYENLKAITDKFDNVSFKASGFLGLRLGFDRLVKSISSLIKPANNAKVAERPVELTQSKSNESMRLLTSSLNISTDSLEKSAETRAALYSKPEIAPSPSLPSSPRGSTEFSQDSIPPSPRASTEYSPDKKSTQEVESSSPRLS